jgi:hypothetical protein
MAKAKKRAAGGGRRPKGSTAKNQLVSVRMDADLLAAIERESDREGKSRAQQIDEMLRWAVDFPKSIQRDWHGQHLYGLGRAIARLVWSVEASTGVFNLGEKTGKTWRDDHFTAAAVIEAVSIFLQRLMPPGFDPAAAPPEPPAEVKAHAEFQKRQFPPEQAAFYQTPAGVGAVAALSLLDQLKTYQFPPTGHPSNVHYSADYFLLPNIKRDLGIQDD